MTEAAHRYSVHGRHEDRHHAKVVVERSFEAAAVAYVEDAHLSDQAEISVIVRHIDSGHERCFRIDTETGEAGACG